MRTGRDRAGPLQRHGPTEVFGTAVALDRLHGNIIFKEASMTWRTFLVAGAAVALAAGGASAQAPKEDPGQSVPQKIREKLSQDGYQDITVAAGSYVVSAKDKDGNRVMMMIGPTSMTVMKVPDNPSTAQMPNFDQNHIIQQ
jgi:hypothetical protein